MNQFLDNLSQHWHVYAPVAGVLFVAFVSCMPKNPPKSLAEIWTWVRSSLQTAIPAARAHEPAPPLDPAPLPLAPPATPAQPQQK